MFKELPMHLLSLLSENKSLTGYDLCKLMSASHIWRASHQQTYRELNKLAENGFLSCQIEPQEGRPDRKVYSLTSEGIANFHKAVADCTPSIKSMHSIRTIMLNVENHRFFEELLEKLRSEIERVEQLLEVTNALPERICMRRAIHINRAEEAYCLEALEYLKSKKQKVA
ncbi:Transcriptional regulator, PadR family [Vibrio nigripulchritudo SOn1]|uniref:Transcriptional regulator, PadR family n=1 Tax=Vibrio nigripulchritudo SOn1 TaxID=1238450 RepID=A0AAV2VLB3_9VIBR|nr:PadR family transcriptional regulator [Vibrio nigripulchritudo]CCO45440.1 Transcriptional regulator, PadR family [Vibrio nigripulchritudo SOn1]